MHRAASMGKIEIIKFLAPMIDEHNSRDETVAIDELNSRDENGVSPIDAAKVNGHHEIVKFLESYEKPSKRARLE